MGRSTAAWTPNEWDVDVDRLCTLGVVRQRVRAEWSPLLM
jgi:hypothetical protein